MVINNDNFLIVPITLDVLCIPPAGSPCLEPIADFSKLPYYKRKPDGSLQAFNSGAPYLSETVLSQPFNDSNALLEPGVHLHWSLPDALTRAVHTQGPDGKDHLEFPVVPNRWFVVRYKNNEPHYFWMVKSDFLWPEHFSFAETGFLGDVRRPHVTWHHQTPAQAGQSPFRYLGHVVGWGPGFSMPSGMTGDSVEKLTAIGFGDPLFAAFYPNCRDVFGLCDTNIWQGQDMTQIRYEVFGWYSAPEQDALSVFLKGYKPESYAGKSLLEALKSAFKWTLPENEQETMPGKILCYAQHRFAQAAPPDKPKALSGQKPIEAAIGSTGTEALSAYMAGKMSTDEKTRVRIENQLESLDLQGVMQQTSIDIGPAFEEARHTKSFSPVSGGRIWDLRPETAAAADQERLNQDPDSLRYFLLPDFTARLTAVNRLQKHLNKSNAGIESLRRQIFTDWHKYMVCCYHDDAGQYPDIDEIRLHLEDLMDLLRLMLAYTGNIAYSEQGGWTADAVPAKSALPAVPDYERLVPRLQHNFVKWLDAYKVANTVPPSLAQRIAGGLNEMAQALAKRHAVVTTIRNLHGAFKSDKNIWTNGSAKVALVPLRQQLATFTAGEPMPDWPVFNTLDQLTDNSLPLTADLKNTILATLAPLAALPALHLEALPAPRFWQPNEPVLLLAGPAVQTTDRHGMDGQNHPDGLHLCFPLGIALSTPLLNTADKATLDGLLAAKGAFRDPVKNPESAHIGDGNPWNVLGFEWEVFISPLDAENNLKPENLQFSKDFITHNYDLSETRSEFLALRPGRGTSASDSYFSGRGILTPYAEERLNNTLRLYIALQAKRFLQNRIDTNGKLTSAEQGLMQFPLGQSAGDTQPWFNWMGTRTNRADMLQFFDNQYYIQLTKTYWSALPPDTDEDNWTASEKRRQILTKGTIPDKEDQLISFFSANRKDIFSWLDAQSGGKTMDRSALHAMIEASDTLESWHQTGNFIQTQSLDGFNAALLMHRKTWQIEVAEPNAFPDYAAFTERVAKAVGNDNLSLGLPHLDFHPLRTGRMNINRLRLVDTFGRTHIVIDQTVGGPPVPVFVPERMKGQQTGDITLPARISQPSRLRFRWLSAQDSDEETNTPPDSNPICGWLVPNYLDDSLMLYDAEGLPAGWFDLSGIWRMTPGSQTPISIYEISNPALRKMALWIRDQALQKGDFIPDFINIIAKILAQIDPEDSTQHQARSLLTGRPVALVQALVEIDLKGWPAVHQDWAFFDRVLKGENYQTDNFTQVEIPIRIGEHQRFNDGVVGFWRDTAEGYQDDLFYTPLRQLTFTHALGNLSQRLAVLMDPRGLLHCTTGILPTKALSIPPEHFTRSLQRIQVAFLTAPVLSDPTRINLILPDEPGFAWSWLQRSESQWIEMDATPRVLKTDILRAFEDGAAVWERLIANGWINPLPYRPDIATVADKTARSQPDLFRNTDTADQKKQWADRKNDIETSLDMLLIAIASPSLDMRFGATQEIREGWLTLKPTT
jgi:hypothetical protein